jgi:hypothetical protein
MAERLIVPDLATVDATSAEWWDTGKRNATSTADGQRPREGMEYR